LSRLSLRLSLGLTLAGAGALGVAVACGEPSHVFEGRHFRPEGECLERTSSVDVVEGERPGDCAPVCLAQPLAGGARAIYVATMCPPYPFSFDAGGADPLCSAALGALDRSAGCLADGGSSNPAPRDAETE
jgi:hypothetical protein